MLATLDFILYIVFPDQTFYTTVVWIIPKMYANTILVILNSRVQVVGGRDEENYGTIINSTSIPRSNLLFEHGPTTVQTTQLTQDVSTSVNHLAATQQMSLASTGLETGTEPKESIT
ncbi:hypothetical protein VKT23_015374 [Stygiomarasmius scandens]|uniref:Uncharacterized protein n=1 Tax=Marasmiellus scandens TaxID=2682957 RepID=A0ABR1IYF2_9AGAR